MVYDSSFVMCAFQVSDLDPAMLDALEQRLDAAANEYAISGIETSVEQLTQARTWQQKRITSYKEEIRQLQLEVANIYEIKMSLPDGCYRQTKLEPWWTNFLYDSYKYNPNRIRNKFIDSITYLCYLC